MQQAIFQRQRLTQCCALGAEAAAIGGMVEIAGDFSATAAVRLRDDATADAAIRASGTDGDHAASARNGTWPASSRKASISWRRQNSKKVSVAPRRWASHAASSCSMSGGSLSNTTSRAYSRAIACSAVEAAPPPI